MTSHHIRNLIAILLVLTLANLVASFTALRAVRADRDLAATRHARIDATLARIDDAVTHLCAERGTTCAAPEVVSNPPAAR